MVQAHRLFKSRDDKVFFGVAGGHAEYLDIDPVLIRVGWVVLAVITGGIAFLIYLVLAFVTPEIVRSSASSQVIDDASADAAQVDDVRTDDVQTARHRTRNIIAGGLIVVGMIILLNNLGVFGVIRWDIIWPIVIIALGATILIPSIRR